MKLTSIELTNYRCYQDFHVDFGPGINVIAGVNGSGKTSLLKGVREALAMSITRFSLPIPNFTPILGEGDPAYVRPEQIGDRWRFEPQLPIRVVAHGELLGKAFTWSGEVRALPGSPRLEGTSPAELLVQSVHPGEQITYPLFAFYPAYRAWPIAQVSEASAATLQSPRAAGYINWWDASGDSNALLQWSIAKSIERLQFATDRTIGWDSVDDDELAVVNRALNAVLGDAKGLRFDFAQKSLRIDWVNGEPPTMYRNLSDGQRVAIALVSDIARRMCLLNPHLGREVATQTPGIVLIDELDKHLHPKWQRLMVRGLAAAFPKVQFIATSHSPQVLSELRPESIILLTLDGATRPQASYGLDANRVLEQIMDADPRPTDVEEALSALFALIEQNDLPLARTKLAQLKVLTPGLPELAGAETLIKRKEVLGR